MNRADLIRHIAKNRARKIRLTLDQVAQAIQDAPGSLKTELVNAINQRNEKAVAQIVLGLATAKRAELAVAEVQNAVVDDTFTVQELLGLLE